MQQKLPVYLFRQYSNTKKVPDDSFTYRVCTYAEKTACVFSLYIVKLLVYFFSNIVILSNPQMIFFSNTKGAQCRKTACVFFSLYIVELPVFFLHYSNTKKVSDDCFP